ncbi:MAG: 50S ribosomal protein L6 [Patescibacteria group bacterium]
MSRIAKKIILIPTKTEVTVSQDVVTVKGPLGEVSRKFRPGVVSITISPDGVEVKPTVSAAEAGALWGTYASHVKNMLDGVNTLYKKVLILEGIGYKAELQGANLLFSLGFSHPVKIAIPSDLKVSCEKNVITISGIDNERVGAFAAALRDLKKPEPYKGKGIRYQNEVILRKEGKKSAV